MGKSSHGTLQRIAAPAVGALLIFALAWAGWSIHRRLPEGGDAPSLSRRRSTESTALLVRLRRPKSYERVADERVAVQLYPVSVDAARKEYDSERRPGVRFEEFLLRRMSGREPITAEFDESDEAMLAIPQGRWWVHVTLDGPEELTWRLPVNVTGREKTIELTPENVYLRARSF